MLIYAADACFTALAHILFMVIWRRLRFIKMLIMTAVFTILKANTKARFHVAVRTQINKFVFYFIVRRNVKFGCSEC